MNDGRVGVSRRDWIKTAGVVGLAAAAAGEATGLAAADPAAPVTSIGGRRELFVDTSLVAGLSGAARLQLNRPTPQEVSFVNDRPWEGSSCAYMKVFRDGDLYRMYYRGSDVVYTKDGYSSPHPEVCCYAESTDGVHWKRPELGLFEFEGSKKNNIVWMGPGSHNFAPFLDENPKCPAEQRYKALAGSFSADAVTGVTVSADGLNSDIHASAKYRAHLVGVMAKRAVAACA